MSRAVNSRGATKQTPGFTHGMIVTNYAATIPDGWVLCDGTNGTPDLRDRVSVGASSVGFGSAAGTISPTASLTHAGSSVAAHSGHSVGQGVAHTDHSIGQAAAHGSHTIGQAANHANHSANATHTHDSHTTSTATASGQTVIADNFTHAADGDHTHDAHSAHTGANLDAHDAHTGAALDAHNAHSGFALDAHSAHSVTQPASHPPLKHYLLAKIMYVGG